MHTLAHIGFIVSSGCAGISGLILFLFALVIVSVPRKELKNCEWGLPAVFAGLGVFWALVAVGLNRL